MILYLTVINKNTGRPVCGGVASVFTRGDARAVAATNRWFFVSEFWHPGSAGSVRCPVCDCPWGGETHLQENVRGCRCGRCRLCRQRTWQKRYDERKRTTADGIRDDAYNARWARK
ncbi:MAG: hypothetical protein KGL39_11550 [Patescibacteria group bacterium]|nr:hypothetical protein [Patescibacteria group bacterium]